eukprot:CAMPEP_0197589816 /NCGR_PEP_ID=MMETSP1326-20131121/10624_1 /TAXON_ID=1155430 /ORGANISM="Genus nov. species nov., Strain RCC2288" /LENGTH=257 /DNA_ID=CAMNT_0043154797 /DNA_START=620 /DNA_END=1393 /DNA_ORIENTATION=+
MSENLEKFLNQRYAVRLPLRENLEVNTEAYFLDGSSSFAKCFVETWISKGCTSGNVDQGSLNELLLELATNPSQVTRHKELRLSDYNRWLSAVYASHLDMILRLRCHMSVLVTPPFVGYWKSLECPNPAFDASHWFMTAHKGVPLNHGCKQMIANYGTAQEKNLICDIEAGPRNIPTFPVVDLDLAGTKKLVNEQCALSMFPFFAYLPACSAEVDGDVSIENLCIKDASAACQRLFYAMEECPTTATTAHASEKFRS